ncbi:hypothetical protein AgCh_027490 [Apium graveolens]
MESIVRLLTDPDSAKFEACSGPGYMPSLPSGGGIYYALLSELSICKTMLGYFVTKDSISGVDAAVLEDRDGIGFRLVARDLKGELVEATTKFQMGMTSPVIAEAMAFKEALSWMDDRGWHDAVVEIDCLNVVQTVRSRVSMRSYFGLIIEDCRRTLEQLNNIKLSFVKRSANMVAHQLARISYYLSGRSFDRRLVARDLKGELVEATTKFQMGMTSPVIAEAMAFKEALSWMDDRGWHDAVVEIDCLNVVQTVRSRVSMRSYFGLIIEDCRRTLEQLNNIKLSFVKRSANMVAHQLARISYYLSGRSFDRRSVPISIQNCFSTDLIDAAVLEDRDGIRFRLVARDLKGELVEATTKFQMGMTSPVIAEAMAFKEALSWMDDRGWHDAVVEIDCLNVVQTVRSRVSMRSYFGLIIEDCRRTLEQLNNIKLSFVKRSANMVAHQLARISYYLSGRSFDRRSVPISIQNCFSTDLST